MSTSAVWGSLKRSLQCKTEPADVHDPKANHNGRNRTGKEGNRCVVDCQGSLADIKIVIHGNRRHSEKQSAVKSPSKGTNEILNPITHEIVLDSGSSCEIKDFQCCPCHCKESRSSVIKEKEPQQVVSGGKSKRATRSPRNPHVSDVGGSDSMYSNPDPNVGSDMVCFRCGEQLKNPDVVEEHYIYKHSVTELQQGDSSWHVIETICRTSGHCSPKNSGKIDRLLKVHNMRKTIAWFEQHRESVKLKASKLTEKLPRCLADGNELLRFQGTTIACDLGLNGSLVLCSIVHCGVCQILKHGFPIEKDRSVPIGVYTTLTSRKAYESIKDCDGCSSVRKALMVCRVIAGKVHSPMEEAKEDGDTGYDSWTKHTSSDHGIEELYILNPRGLLPCFVVIYNPERE